MGRGSSSRPRIAGSTRQARQLAAQIGVVGASAAMVDAEALEDAGVHR
jgi:hypothetical protein